MKCLIVPMYIFRVLIFYNVDSNERLLGLFSPLSSFRFFLILCFSSFLFNLQFSNIVNLFSLSFFLVVTGDFFGDEMGVVEALDTGLAEA